MNAPIHGTFFLKGKVMEINFENKNPVIIILSGKAKSGKDLSFNYIKKLTNKKIISLSYSNYLKQYVSNITSWDFKEETKPREFLQNFGIEFLPKIKEDFLIKRTLEDIDIYSYFYDLIVITDARLIKEIEIPKNKYKNIYSIRINKLNNNYQMDEKLKKHITETNLDNYNKFDYMINYDNNEQLNNKLKEILEEIYE